MQQKTDLVAIYTPSRLMDEVDIKSEFVSDIRPASTACNLGDNTYQNETIQPYVSSLVNSCNW